MQCKPIPVSQNSAHLRELHFPQVEVADAGNLVPRMNNSWRLPLCLRQRDVNQLGGRRHNRDRLEVVVRHDGGD